MINCCQKKYAFTELPDWRKENAECSSDVCRMKATVMFLWDEIWSHTCIIPNWEGHIVMVINFTLRGMQACLQAASNLICREVHLVRWLSSVDYMYDLVCFTFCHILLRLLWLWQNIVEKVEKILENYLLDSTQPNYLTMWSSVYFKTEWNETCIPNNTVPSPSSVDWVSP